MTGQTAIEDDQPRGSVLVAVASGCRGVEHLVAEVVVTAGFARATYSKSVPVADLRLPLATVEPEQHGCHTPGPAPPAVPDTLTGLKRAGVTAWTLLPRCAAEATEPAGVPLMAPGPVQRRTQR